MPKRDRGYYLALRQQYRPEKIKLAIVAESPPASGRYFYDPSGVLSEALFAAFMRHLGLSPATKDAGLREFQQRGWVLVDATYEPVNALDDASRDRVIARDYPLLRNDLAALLPDRTTPLVVIKANVCRLLEPRLKADGFNVLNSGRAIYFPSSGRQKEFQQQLTAALSPRC